MTETIYWALAETNLGQMLLAHTERGICRLSFDEGEAELAVRFPNAALVEGGVYTRALVGSAIAAIRDPQNMPDLPLDLRGTAFQQAVWLALRDIPAGETRTYADIAAQIRQPNAVRATGSANGANPVSVLVPCHRVIRADGGLGGYAWGLERKRALLAREANEPALL